ncbi:RNA polymerase sigma factor [Bosea sp. F3-2]|uniref:RNA polymerase sigma factor n=1 Tax=Bosea sp. F3-2 TaxID=2599640 RepID=UPI0011EF6F57|nr:RNA polymerase sigma factor [Bosea sp. F3-2]QEL25689.1 RNA polymerase sigma factor [Bosea sp. F3-2]
MLGSDAHRTVETVWRMEAPKLIAGLARLTRDVGRAEELAQDALVAALKQWPEEGVPRNPAAWLMQVAKHRAADAARHEIMARRKQDEIGRDIESEGPAMPDLDEALDDEVGDDLLRLIFTACHPVLPKEARLALTLRLLGGLTTEEIARAFLVPEPTMAQRIVRAKKTLSEAKVPYDVPAGAELGERLASVLEVIYLIFNEGYAATAGQDWVRPALCEEALRLGRILAARAPEEPEVHGLVALMELQASRLRARVGPEGEPILLLDQNRARWDRLLIGRGLAALERAQRLAGTSPGPYLLQAALAACHARARTAEETDWQRIAALYAVLGRVMPSPIVELNRAVAVGMAEGPAAGLELVEALGTEPALKRYHLLPSVRGDLLSKLGRHREAAEAFEEAVALTGNVKERVLMEERAAAARAAME